MENKNSKKNLVIMGLITLVIFLFWMGVLHLTSYPDKANKEESITSYIGYAFAVGIENRTTNSIMWGEWEQDSTEILVFADRDLFQLRTPIPQNYRVIKYLGAKKLAHFGQCMSYQIMDSHNNKGKITFSIRAEDGYVSVMTFNIGGNTWRYKCLMKEIYSNNIKKI